MLDEIQKEINSFYGKYASGNNITLAEAKKRISQLDIEEYGRKAEKYVNDKTFTKRANDEMRLYNATMKINRLEMLKSKIGANLVAGHSEIENMFGDILNQRTLDEFERQSGILGKSVKDNDKRANAIVNSSFHNATFSDRIWMNQSLLNSKLNDLLQTGLIRGKNPRTLASELRKTFDVGAYNAERLMRTELARVQTEAQKQEFERNGFSEYEFVVNGNCCDICAGLNGKHFKVKDMMPGENAPPMHPNCRCSVAPYEDREEYEKWIDYLDKGGTTEGWNRQESIAKLLNLGYNRQRNKFKTIPHKEYTEPMTKKHVRHIMKEMGVSYGKASIRLESSAEYIGKGIFGYTNPNGKEVIFYPDAFMSREELVKTIGHEKIHHLQLIRYGPSNDSVLARGFEEEAYGSEEKWWKDYIRSKIGK